MADDRSLDAFIAWYDAAHQNAANRIVHHAAHGLAIVGAVTALRRPFLGLLLVALALPISWTGHYLFERNTPAFFDAPDEGATGGGLAKKAEVALGGVMWSVVCLWRVVSQRG